MRSALIISYYYPPSGGPGVQRVLKFTKYLPQLGWRPLVLTVPETADFPARDETLHHEIPPEAAVFRSSIVEFYDLYRKFLSQGRGSAIDMSTVMREGPGWKEKLTRGIRARLFIPDGRMGWLRPGVTLGRKIIETERPEVILATGPPFTAHWIGKKLAEWSGLPLVLDFRDPWTEATYYPTRPGFARRLDLRLQKACLDRASRVLTVNEQIREDLERLYSLDPGKFVTIANGFDESDFPASTPKFEKWTLAHTGSIFKSRVPGVFLEEFGNWLREDPARTNQIRLVLAGRLAPEMKTALAKYLPPEVVDERGYVSHDESVRILQQSHRLLLLTGLDAQSEGMLTGKVFEYLGSGTQILALAPPAGELSTLLRRTGAGTTVDPRDRSAVRKVVEGLGQAAEMTPTDTGALTPYTRRALTARLADVFAEIT